MRDMTRITVPLSADEIAELRRISNAELRHPRDQARIMLRRALGIPNSETTGRKFGDPNPVASDLS